jgi:PRTRC genetic system protein B
MENHNHLYHPTSALVFFSSTEKKSDCYIEYYDMDRNSNPINAHPLTLKEANKLRKSLNIAKEEKEPVLKTEGILTPNIVFLDAVNSKVIWHTKAMQTNMYFTEKLGLPNGIANVPPMLWVASRTSLYVYALRSNRRPTVKTRLYHAPFFNIYESGNVCLGNVDVQIGRTASLEEFTRLWQGYFFNSYFSHLLAGHNPIKGNCVSLWKSLIESGKPFPLALLKPSIVNLLNLLK